MHGRFAIHFRRVQNPCDLKIASSQQHGRYARERLLIYINILPAIARGISIIRRRRVADRDRRANSRNGVSSIGHRCVPRESACVCVYVRVTWERFLRSYAHIIYPPFCVFNHGRSDEHIRKTPSEYLPFRIRTPKTEISIMSVPQLRI